MVGMAMGLFLRFGLPQATAKRLAPVVLVFAVFLIIALVWGGIITWRNATVRAAIEADRTMSREEVRSRQIVAERAASAAKADRDRREEQKQLRLEDRVDEAEKGGGTAADDVWNHGLWD